MSIDAKIENLEIRLQRLERRSKWWKRTAVSASILAVTIALMNPRAYSQREAPQQTDTASGVPSDAKNVSATYTNFFRATGTPEELVLDFGLNMQQKTATVPEPVKINNRIVMNFYTAKRLLNALKWAVDRYEKSFGEIETDFKKRMIAKPPADKQ